MSRAWNDADTRWVARVVGREHVNVQSQYARDVLERLLGATQGCEEYGARVAGGVFEWTQLWLCCWLQ